MEKLLVCTDLDRTLIPNGAQPESPKARAFFAKIVGQSEVTLAYVTGRHLALVEQAIAEYDLPQPDLVVADVGSTIYERDGEQWRRSPQWDEALSVDWQGKTATDLAAVVTAMGGCRLQESEKQGLHKLSFYIELTAPVEKIIADVKNQFAAADIKANFIWSIDEAEDIGLLDILPCRANKYEAIAFLMKNHDFDVSNTVFSGDSGNDRDVLVSPIPATLVANAHGDLKKSLLDDPQTSQSIPNLYVAKGDFLGLNGNYSGGIVEGICHYHPEYLTLLGTGDHQ